MKIYRKLVKKLGPGFVTGSSDDDPSGIATYSAAGAKYNLSMLWLSLFTIPLMVAIQEMCARLSMVTGVGLAKVFRNVCNRRLILLCVLLLAVANIFNLGADLNMMAASIALLIPGLPFFMLILAIAGFSVFLEIFVSYKTYFKFLKWLCLSLLAYWFTALLVVADWTVVFNNLFTPQWEGGKDFLLLAVAFLGTTISPYLFFWQSSAEVEDEISAGRKNLKQRRGATKKEVSGMRLDVMIGMIFSNLTTFFIIVTTANTLFKNGLTNLETPAQVAFALQPLAGSLTYALFALGVIGTGLIAIPILAGSVSYAVSELFNFREGLFLKWRQGRNFYAIMVLAVVLGVIVNLAGLPPVKALIYSSVLNAFIAPLFIYLIIKAASSQKIMGNLKSGKLSKFFSWLTFYLMAGSGLALLAVLLF